MPSVKRGRFTEGAMLPRFLKGSVILTMVVNKVSTQRSSTRGRSRNQNTEGGGALTRARRGNTVHWIDSSGAQRSGVALEFSSDCLLAARGVEGMNCRSLWVVPYASIVETTFGPDSASLGPSARAGGAP